MVMPIPLQQVLSRSVGLDPKREKFWSFAGGGEEKEGGGCAGADGYAGARS